MPTTAEVEFPHFQPYRSPSNSLDMIVQLYLCIYFAICCAEAATKAYLHLPIREPESRYWSARQRPARKDPAEGETRCRFNYFNILIIIYKASTYKFANPLSTNKSFVSDFSQTLHKNPLRCPHKPS